MNRAPVTVNAGWKSLYRIGAIAALVAALGFRRNMGAEMTMFFGAAPKTAAGWFTLLQNNRLLGIIALNFLDIIDYALVGIMFVALYVAFRKTSLIFAAAATSMCLAGIIVYVVSSTSFKILSLSNQYSSASTTTQKTALLTAAQTVLAKGVPGAGYQGVGGVVSIFLIAIAGLVISAVMLRSKIFYRITGYVGIMASVFDLAYLIGTGSVPSASFNLWSSIFVGGAGLLLMIWHLLIGIKLYNIAGQSKGGHTQ
ncbi:MAG: hypothetical protein ABSE15_04060 [Candidatus Bathyarchaeia archaeon]|jgi:hypothetical protein